jgi:hypothetical protein
MSKLILGSILSSVVLVGCTTVQMPNLSPSHPAHPEADAASLSSWLGILRLREEPLITPPLPIASSDRATKRSPDNHNAHSTAEKDVGIAMYVCPMDPEITSHSPGSCSKCGMALEKNSGD